LSLLLQHLSKVEWYLHVPPTGTLNEEDTALVGTEHNTVKLKHIIPNNQINTGKSSKNASDERERELTKNTSRKVQI